MPWSILRHVDHVERLNHRYEITKDHIRYINMIYKQDSEIQRYAVMQSIISTFCRGALHILYFNLLEDFRLLELQVSASGQSRLAHHKDSVDWPPNLAARDPDHDDLILWMVANSYLG